MMKRVALRLPLETVYKKDGVYNEAYQTFRERKVSFVYITNVKDAVKFVDNLKKKSRVRIAAVDSRWIPDVGVLLVAATKALNDQHKNVMRANSIEEQVLHNLSPKKTVKMVELVNSETRGLVLLSFEDILNTDLKSLVNDDDAKIVDVERLIKDVDKDFLCIHHHIEEKELSHSTLAQAITRRVSSRDC